MTTSYAQRLSQGLKRNPWHAFGSIFIIYSILWTLLEPMVALLPIQVIPSNQKFITFLILAVIIGLSLRAIPAKVELSIPGSNTTVTIFEGDILSFKGHRIIAVNEFFDSEIGDLVSATSLHGKCIQEFFNGDSRRFETETDQALSAYEYETIERTRGRNRKYEIGTTATVPCGGHLLFLTALSRTDIQTLKAKAEVEDLWITLRQVWQIVRSRANGQSVAIPLLGSGLAGVDIPYLGILNIILLSLISETHRGEITKNIQILLSPEAFSSIDLGLLAKEWKK